MRPETKSGGVITILQDAVSPADVEVQPQVVVAVPVQSNSEETGGDNNQQQTVTAMPVVQRSRSATVLREGARRAASASVLPMSLARQHSSKAWNANTLQDAIMHALYGLVILLIFSLQFAPHIAALLIVFFVGGGLCAQPLASWLLVVGGVGLGVHVLVLVAMLLQDKGTTVIICCCALPFVVGWTVCVFALVANSWDCEAFDVAELNRLDVNRTLFAEPLLPDASLAATHAHALAHCAPNTTDVLNQTRPCAYVLFSACEPNLWHAARGLALFWVIVDGAIASIFGGGVGCLVLGIG